MLAGAIFALLAVGTARGGSTPVIKFAIDVPCETSSVDMEISNLEKPVLAVGYILQKRFTENRMDVPADLLNDAGVLRQDRRIRISYWRHEKPNYFAVLKPKNYNFVKSTDFQNGVLPLRT